MAQVQKIYSIKLTGQDDVINQMNKTNKAFEDAKKSFKELKTIVGKGGLSTGDLEKYKVELAASKLETEKLRQETLRLNNEGKAYANAIRVQREEQRKSRQEIEYTEGSLKDMQIRLIEMKKELSTKTKIEGLSEEEIKKSTAEIRKLEDQIRSVTRSFSSEGTNVAEYTRGIVNSLKESGLDKIITTQINSSKEKVNELEEEFKQLANRYSSLKNGSSEFKAVERTIIQNRQEVEKLTASINKLESEMGGIGTVGKNITDSIKKDLQTQNSLLVMLF